VELERFISGGGLHPGHDRTGDQLGMGGGGLRGQPVNHDSGPSQLQGPRESELR
jgi:hypothetical protein